VQCPLRILEDACHKTGVKLQLKSHDNYVVSGHMDKVARTMHEVHAVDWKVAASQNHERLGNTVHGVHVTANYRRRDTAAIEAVSDEESKNNVATDPLAGRQRKLKVQNEGEGDSHVRGIETEERQTGSCGKVEHDKPIRKLKGKTTSGEDREGSTVDVRCGTSQDDADVQRDLAATTTRVKASRQLKKHEDNTEQYGTDTATKQGLSDAQSCHHRTAGFRHPQSQNTTQIDGHDQFSRLSHVGVKSDFVIQSDLGNSLQLVISSGINVYIHQADMIHQQTQVIVNSANEQLFHGGGLARAILTAAGPAVDVESRQIIASGGVLRMGDIVHTSAGNIAPPVRYVIHAVPPTGHQMKSGDEHECMNALIQTFYGSMQYANDQLAASSISLPPFGAGMCHII